MSYLTNGYTDLVEIQCSPDDQHALIKNFLDMIVPEEVVKESRKRKYKQGFPDEKIEAAEKLLFEHITTRHPLWIRSYLLSHLKNNADVAVLLYSVCKDVLGRAVFKRHFNIELELGQRIFIDILGDNIGNTIEHYAADVSRRFVERYTKSMT